MGNLFVTNLSEIVIPQKMSSNYTKKIFHLIIILFIAVSVHRGRKFYKALDRAGEIYGEHVGARECGTDLGKPVVLRADALSR